VSLKSTQYPLVQQEEVSQLTGSILSRRWTEINLERLDIFWPRRARTAVSEVVDPLVALVVGLGLGELVVVVGKARSIPPE